jgi:hypothetical protein
MLNISFEAPEWRVVILRRGDTDVDLWRGSIVEDERTGKLCIGGMEVLVAIKLLRPSLTPTSAALKGTKVPPEGKMGDVKSVSADLGAFRPSSRIELLVVSRLIEESRATESFRA